NALLATLVSYSNEVAALCEAMPGLDEETVMTGVHLDRRLTPVDGAAGPAGIVSYLRAGVGFGGSCLPKDVDALRGLAAERGVATPLLDAVMAVNRQRAGQVVTNLGAALGGLARVPEPRLAGVRPCHATAGDPRRPRCAPWRAAPGGGHLPAHRPGSPGRMSDPFRLVLISAWNDSGGGFLHRLFDGHPECFVYPFELQLGTALLHDGFESWFRPKYRWPILPEDLGAASPEQLFELFLDDEVKGCLRGRAASKFREFDLELSMEAWRTQFAARLGAAPRTPERVIAAYVGGLFAAWRNRRGSGRERIYLGHCPTIVLDA